MDFAGGSLGALVLGLMVTLFGGMALCYGLVMLGEKIVHRLRRTRPVPVSVPSVRRAA